MRRPNEEIEKIDIYQSANGEEAIDIVYKYQVRNSIIKSPKISNEL